MDDVVKGLFNVYRACEPTSQWRRAVNGLSKMNNLEVAQTWFAFVATIPKDKREVDIYSTLLEYKMLFKLALKEIDKGGLGSSEKIIDISEINESLRSSLTICAEYKKALDDVDILRRMLADASNADDRGSEHFNDAIESVEHRRSQIRGPVEAVSLSSSHLASDLQSLRTAHERDTALLRTAVHALESGAARTSSAVAALGSRVDGGQGAVDSIASRVVALETNQTALDEHVKDGTTLAAAAHKRLITVDETLTQVKKDITTGKQATVAAFQKAESAEQASTALRAQYTTVLGAMAAAGDVAKQALDKARKLEATALDLEREVAGLEQRKVDKTEFNETIQSLKTTAPPGPSQRDAAVAPPPMRRVYADTDWPQNISNTAAAQPPRPAPTPSASGARPAGRSQPGYAAPTAASAAKSPPKVTARRLSSGSLETVHVISSPNQYVEPIRNIVRDDVPGAAPFVPGGVAIRQVPPATLPSAPASGPKPPGSPSASEARSDPRPSP